MTEPRRYHMQGQTVVTIAGAARMLEVSAQTFKKWVNAGYVKVVVIGPPGMEIRRIPLTEVERLKRAP